MIRVPLVTPFGEYLRYVAGGSGSWRTLVAKGEITWQLTSVPLPYPGLMLAVGIECMSLIKGMFGNHINTYSIYRHTFLLGNSLITTSIEAILSCKTWMVQVTGLLRWKIKTVGVVYYFFPISPSNTNFLFLFLGITHLQCTIRYDTIRYDTI